MPEDGNEDKKNPPVVQSAGTHGCVLLCGRSRKARGLCSRHYRHACDRVRAGEVTWDELERLGQCLPMDLAKRRDYGKGRFVCMWDLNSRSRR